jgi:NADH-quinone oxidoreductase subunit I
MQALTNKVKPVSRGKMNLWERMYLPEIFKGMFITFKHIFRRKVTLN